MRQLIPTAILLGSLLGLGCRQPLQVVTKICSGVVPVRIKADAIPPININEIPVNITTDLRELPSLPLKDGKALERMTVQSGDSNAGQIAIIDVDGILLNKNATGLMSAGENPVAIFREKLDLVEASESFVGVVVRINSPGGGVTATDIMRRDLDRFRDRTNLPVVACLMDVGAGGAYYLATSTDTIVAHPTTIVGGLGVILNLFNMEDTLAMLSLVGTPVRAGERVDLGSPIRMMTEENRQLLQDVADKFHDRLRQKVSMSRIELEREDELFDGRIFTAPDAMRFGLIDELGYLDDAIDRCRAKANAPAAGVVILHRPRDPARTPYAVTPNAPVTNGIFPRVAGLNRSQLPTFLYIWQPDPSIETAFGN